MDTADPASIEAAARTVLVEHPDLDVLIAMAGIMRAEDWTDPAGSRATAEATVTTNLLGPIRLIAAFMEHLLAQPSATIMTVSSGLAFVPLRPTPTYNATKAAIHMLSESLRLQLSRHLSRGPRADPMRRCARTSCRDWLRGSRRCPSRTSSTR